MDWTALLPGLGGGLFGLAEGIVGIFKAKDQNKHELAMMDKSIDATRVESETQIARERVIQEGNAAEADARNLAMSMAMDKATYSSGLKLPELTGWSGKLLGFLLGFVDFMRGSFRPGATWACLVTSLYLYLTTGSVPPDLFALTQLMVGWWFGSRGVSKAFGR